MKADPRSRERADVAGPTEDGFDLRDRVRVGQQRVPNTDVELAGDGLADRHLVRCRRVGQPARDQPGAVDAGPERRVDRRAAGLQDRQLRQEDAVGPQLRHRRCPAQALELAHLTGGRLSEHRELDVGRAAVPAEPVQ